MFKSQKNSNDSSTTDLTSHLHSIKNKRPHNVSLKSFLVAGSFATIAGVGLVTAHADTNGDSARTSDIEASSSDKHMDDNDVLPGIANIFLQNGGYTKSFNSVSLLAANNSTEKGSTAGRGKFATRQDLDFKHLLPGSGTGWVNYGMIPNYARMTHSTHGESTLYHQVFGKNGYLAYCTDYYKNTPTNGNKMKVSPAGEMTRKIILNGYPMKSPSALGLDNQNQAEAATQYAMWSLRDKDFKLGYLHSITGASGTKVIAAAKRIYAAAEKDKRTSAQPKLTLQRIGSRTLSADKKSYIYKYKTGITGGYKAVDAKISKTGWKMNGAVLKQGSKTLKVGSDVSVGKELTVTLKREEGKKTDFNFQIDSYTDGYAKVLNGEGNIKGQQGVAFASTISPKTLVLHAKQSGNTTKPSDQTPPTPTDTTYKINLHKVGEEDDSLEGVRFTLVKVEKDGTQVPIQDKVTDSDGNITFDGLAGNTDYIIREDHSDGEHDLLLTDTHVSIGDEDEDVTIQNTEIKDKPLIRSFATEADTSTTKGSRYVDAKSTDVDDELLLDNLDPGHSYRVVDRAYVLDADASTDSNNYDKELKPVTDANGNAAQVEESFTADKVDPNNGKDRGYKKLTTHFKGLDLKGLQGKRIVFQATVYRGDDASTHAGDELAKEDTYHDTNQTLKVNKPKITTTATSNGATEATQPQDDNGNKVTNPYSKTQISDYAHITDLVVGHKYTVHLKEMTTDDKGNAIVYLDPSTSKPVTKEYTFTATDPAMDIKTDFPTFSTVGKDGKKLTVYYNITPSDDSSNKLGYEEKIDDANETIRVTTPQIKTHASIDDDSITNPSLQTSLKDLVDYTDVAPNQPLELGAIASNTHGNAILDKIGDKYYNLMGKIKFTPTSADGSQYVPLQLVDAATPDKTKADDNKSDADNEANIETVSLSNKATRQSINKLNPVTEEDVEADPVAAAKISNGANGVSDPYHFDSRFLAGRSMVMFEDLWENPDKPMASHADVNDQGQTVKITNPKLHTEALLNDHHTSNPNRLSYLYDHVKYTGVAPGHMFNMSALAVDPATGHNIVVKVGSNDYYNLMGRIMVNPSAADGSVDVPLQKVTATDQSIKDYQADQKAKADGKGNTPSGADNTPTNNNDKNSADDSTKGNGNSKTSVVISTTFTDDEIKSSVNAINQIADDYNVSHAALDAEVQKATQTGNPMTDTEKAYIVKEFNKVAADIKTAQGSKGASSTNEVPVIVTSIDHNSSDAELKSGVADLKIIADRYDVSTKALDDAMTLALRHDPMQASDRDEVIKAYNALVSQIKEIQTQAQKNNDNTDKGNANNPNHTDNGYTTDLSGTTKAAQRLTDNPIVPTSPKDDSDALTPDLKDKANEIDTTSLRGQKMVMVEDMQVGTKIGNDDERTTISSEINMNNKDQTVRVTNPKIHTMQTIDNKKKYVINGNDQDAKVPVVDKVSFTDFAPGEKATLTAVEMDAGTKQPVLLEGQYLIGRKTMTPTTSDGTVTVNFNQFTSVPAARYTTKMLNSDGLMINRAADSEISKEQQANDGTNSNANKDAVDNDETDNNQNDGNVDDSYESDTGTGLGTDNVDSHTDTSAYDLPMKSLETMYNLADGDSASWVAYETAQGSNGDIIAEHKDSKDTDQTITITHHTGDSNNNNNGGGTPSNNINQNQNGNSNHNGQGQTNGSNNVTINNGGGSSNGGGSTNGGTNGGTTNGGGSSNGGGSTNGGSNFPGLPNMSNQNGSPNANGRGAGGSGSGGQGSSTPSAIPSNSTTPAFGTNNTAPAGNGGQVYSTQNRPGFATTGGNSDVSHNWLYNFVYGIFH